MNVPHAAHLREIAISVREAPLDEKVDYLSTEVLTLLTPLLLEAAKAGYMSIDYASHNPTGALLSGMPSDLRELVITAVNDKLKKMCGYDIVGYTSISWD